MLGPRSEAAGVTEAIRQRIGVVRHGGKEPTDAIRVIVGTAVRPGTDASEAPHVPDVLHLAIAADVGAEARTCPSGIEEAAVFGSVDVHHADVVDDRARGGTGVVHRALGRAAGKCPSVVPRGIISGVRTHDGVEQCPVIVRNFTRKPASCTRETARVVEGHVLAF